MGYAIYWVLNEDSTSQDSIYEYEANANSTTAPLDPNWVISTWLITAGLGVLCGLFIIEVRKEKEASVW